MHRYLESSPACWAMYGEVLAREYSDPVRFEAHSLSVDAYALQHPGQPSTQTTRSAALHLLRLYLLIERSESADRARQAMRSAAERKIQVPWLEPPADRGSIRVDYVHAARNAVEHIARVRTWAECTWHAWARHHSFARELARELCPAA